MSNTFKSKARIIEESDGKYILKPTDKNVKELFDYLKTRNYDAVPEIVESDGKSVKYKYIEETDFMHKNKHIDLASSLSQLHYKTAYYKDVSKNKYREIYDKLSDKIEYIENYYNKFIESIEVEVYPSPSHYLISRNYSIINGAINYSKKELKSWFKLVENKTKERVVVVHNNPKLEHLVHGDKDYLVNWDNYVVDTPVLDLYRMYENPEIFNDFLRVYKEYEKNFTLTEEEKKLFFILISIPKKIEEISPEIANTKNIRHIIDHLYKTNELISLIDSENKV